MLASCRCHFPVSICLRCAKLKEFAVYAEIGIEGYRKIAAPFSVDHLFDPDHIPCLKGRLVMVKYLGASIVGTLVHYALLAILIRWYTLPPVWASTCGAIAGAVVIYLANYFITFQSTRSHISATTRFIVVSAIATGVSGLMLNVAMTQMNWPLAPAQVFATGMQFSVGFAINRAWTF